MNRYIYYLIVVNMIANIVATVPYVLLSHSTDGAITAMIIGVIVGVIFTIYIIQFFNRYPQKGLPELMKMYTPKWYYYPILLYLTLMWYLAGTLTLVTFTFMLVTFLSPEMAIITMILPYLVIISYGILMKTQNVLYSTEIIFLLFLPIGLLIFFKAYTDSGFNWDLVRVAIMHSNHLPSFNAFTATVFLYTGVVNLAIFNRCFKVEKFVLKRLLLVIGSISLFTVFTTYFMPIAYSGFENISTLLYPWISTTDSVRMKFGIIERLVFIFLLFFSTMAILSMTIHWHVAAQLLESVVYFKKLTWKKTNLTPYLFILVFSTVAIVLSIHMTEHNLYALADWLYNMLPVFILLFLLTMWLINRGAKNDRTQS